MKLDSRTALVTGGASGIGKACALLLAQHGAHVAVVDVNSLGADEVASQIRSQGRQALAVAADVSNLAEVQKTVETITQTLGKVDILVNNAGYSQVKPFLEVTEEDWDTMMIRSLKVVYNCTIHVLPAMVEQGYGRIVNMSSCAGLSGVALHVHYSAAKAGILGLTKALAKYVARFGITVNAVAPGFVDTPMWRDIPEKLRSQAISLTPVGRLGMPEDIALAVLYLASDEASFITGQVISPNGGYLT